MVKSGLCTVVSLKDFSKRLSKIYFDHGYIEIRRKQMKMRRSNKWPKRTRMKRRSLRKKEDLWTRRKRMKTMNTLTTGMGSAEKGTKIRKMNKMTMMMTKVEV